MLGKIGKSVRQYKFHSIIAPIFTIGEVFFEVLIPYLMALMIDNGFSSEDLPYIKKIGFWMLLCAIGGLACGIFSGRYAAIASSGLAQNLRQDVYYKIQEFSFENIDKFSTASLVTRLTTDITNVQNAYQMVIRMLIRGPIMMIFSLIMAFMMSKSLSVIFLVAIPVLAIFLFYITTHAHPYFKKMFEEYDNLNTVVRENLIGVRTVKAYVREEEEIGKFNIISDLMVRWSTKAESLLVLMDPVMFGAIYVCTLVCSYFGARMIVSESMTTGTLMSLFTYAVQILTSMMMLSMVLVQIVMAMASVNRIVEVLDEESSLTNPDNPVMEVKDGSIDFENMNFGYSDGADKYILRDVNLHIDSGEVIGIIGGTGSSKSSLVNLISRLYDVKDGSVKVGGVDVRDYDIETLRNKVAVVLQKNELFSGTIKENLRWGKEDATDEEIINACRLAQADEFIEKFDDKYDTYIEHGGRNVSGGQKQRLCIARALLKDPKVLILDDSTSAVDTATDAKIQAGFKSYIPDVTKLIIAQRISSVMNADKIIVLDEGNVVGFGSHDELMANNTIYREVYESQQKGGDFDEQ